MPEVPDLNADLQPTAQEDAPVVIDKRPQTVAADTNQLNTAAQIIDGRVRVSDDISDQAVEQGYEPDIQPRAAIPAVAVTTGVGDSLGGQMVSSVLPDTTAGQIQGLREAGKDDEADEIVQKAAAASAALDVIQAPLSVKAEVAAQALVDAGGDAVQLPEGELPAQPTAEELENVEPSTAPDITDPTSGGAQPLEQTGEAPVLETPAHEEAGNEDTALHSGDAVVLDPPPEGEQV